MKVLIVDDSIVYRTAIKAALNSAGKKYEIDVAANGKIAIEKIKQKQFDIITLDLEMPVMDGMEAIEEIRKFDKNLPIIIFSAQNINAANKTLKALELGADDFVGKIEGSTDLQSNLRMINDELIPKFDALTGRLFRSRESLAPATKPADSENSAKLENFKPNIICIASSTGGPDTLKKLFQDLKKLPIPIVIVQHMPPIFTLQLAKTLNSISEMNVVEAKEGDVLEAGTAYIAPGDYHMCLAKIGEKYKLILNQDPKVCYVRPAADVLFKTVSECFSGGILGVILTGMGSDGLVGCEALKRVGSKVIVQDEASSVVYGMPKAVYDAGIHDASLDINQIATTLNKMVLGI